MPNYNFLPNAKSEFPHVSNIDTYKYDNDFDYSRYDYTQMELQICTVPWDMGEAHIGNRTISGIGNVVFFESKAKRDKWFDDIPDSECYRFETKFKELHRDHVIDVSIPYDMCAKHNYLVVRYALFANDDSPVMYEGNDGLREWFWFIREVEFVAPNTTRLHLLDDAFQTWIYDVDVSGMILERGHAPMFKTKVNDYLDNPIGNNGYLLTEDVNYGEATQVKHIDVLGLNTGTMYACIATTANPNGTWTNKTPGLAYRDNNGVPSVYVFAVSAGNLDSFLSNVDANVPQFKQTIQGVFFASADLITIGTSFTFASTTCYNVTSGRKTFNLAGLNKSDFGYTSDYAEIAKLYTFPYAHVEITDENGDVTTVKVEDTTGNIDVNCALSLAFPFVNIDAHLMGVGGNANASITFKNIDEKTFNVSGQWYDTLRSWSVPTFAVILDAATEYDYSTRFDRAQRVVDYTATRDNAYANADTLKANADASAESNRANAHDGADAIKDNVDDSADTLKDNADASADVGKANVDDSADTMLANAALTMAANSATTSRSNQSANTDASNTQTYNTGLNAANNLIVDFTATSTIAANEQQGAISAASSAMSAGVGAIASAVSGDIAGTVSSVANGVIGAATTMAQTSVSNNLTSTNASYAKAGNNASTTAANADTQNKVDNQTATNTDLTDIQNDLVDGTSANSAATDKNNATRTQTVEKDNATRTQTVQKGNALRTQTTDKANATRTETTEKANATRSQTTMKANALRSANASQSAIDNDIAQAALREPYLYGTFANGDTAVTRPIALFAHVVTQSKSAIEAAGDYMLRYGYALDKFWEFDGNWNVGKYFTYWKLRDFWVTNLNVPDMYMDKLRFFLFGGVTVWRKPEDIGRVDIYENFDV